jgi:outer membrane protein
MSRGLLIALILLVCSSLVLPLNAQMPPAQKQAGPPPSPAAAPSQQNVISLTLQQAEALALKNNPQISVARLNALVAQQFVREQRSALLPTATVNLTGVDANPGSRIAAGFLNNPILFSRAAGGATVSQLVTDFGRTMNLLSSSKFQAKAEDQNVVATTADIILAVDQFFYNSLETKALVRVAEDTVKARQTLVDQVQALTNAKLKSEIDLSFSKVELARAQLLLLESKNNYDTALAMLSAILGFPQKQNFQLMEETSQLTPPAPDASTLIQEALGQRNLVTRSTISGGPPSVLLESSVRPPFGTITFPTGTALSVSMSIFRSSTDFFTTPVRRLRIRKPR